MRTISYKCDRCGKPMTSRTAVKISVSLQRGADPAEKSIHDFCQKCFLNVKKGFLASMTSEISVDKAVTVEQDKKAVTEQVEMKPIRPVAKVLNHGKDPADEKPEEVSQTAEEKPAEEKPAVTEPVKERKKPGRKPKEKPMPEPDPETGLVSGPLLPIEHETILKLYVEEGLTAEQIAERIHRLPKGVKRCISSANKSGELDRRIAEHKERQAPVPETIEEEPESYAGSGVSNTGIMKDAYTTPPQTEVVDGKRHDIGAILALAKAGWDPKTIASEKHYDEDVVRVLLEKYMK